MCVSVCERESVRLRERVCACLDVIQMYQPSLTCSLRLYVSVSVYMCVSVCVREGAFERESVCVPRRHTNVSTLPDMQFALVCECECVSAYVRVCLCLCERERARASGDVCVRKRESNYLCCRRSETS